MSTSQESGKYKILFRASGRPALAVEAHYQCTNSRCNTSIAATDPLLRLSLPLRAREDYPVSVAHAKSGTGWHVTEDLENSIEMDQVTYEGCDAIVRRMKHSLAVMYEQQRITYHDHIRSYRKARPDDGTPFTEWPCF